MQRRLHVCDMCDNTVTTVSSRHWCDRCEEEFRQIRANRFRGCEHCPTPVSCVTQKKCLQANLPPDQNIRSANPMKLSELIDRLQCIYDRIGDTVVSCETSTIPLKYEDIADVQVEMMSKNSSAVIIVLE